MLSHTTLPNRAGAVPPTRGRRRATLATLVLGLGLTGGIAAPLLVPQAAEAAIIREEQLGNGPKTWVVPEGVTRVAVSLAGGRGGHGGDSEYNADGTPKDAGNGGSGGIVSGELVVAPGDTLTLFGADAGGNAKTEPREAVGAGGSGWKNGGSGGTYRKSFGRS
ncbi:hypothetical protein OOT08_02520, partial [Leucobacter sp. M11]|nr:hypothetical protein [Leucobacter sp. M11]